MSYTGSRVHGHLALLKSSPLWAHLFIHHRDGYLREAALDRLDGPARNVFAVVAIAHRLNDWVGPVRARADACARRVLPLTDPDLLASAALVLMPLIGKWGRWPQPPAILPDTLNRPDVVQKRAAAFRTARSGPVSTLLRDHLRDATLDDYLFDLACDAFLPGVRAIALAAVVTGLVRWRTGSRWEWVDKSLGRRRKVAVFAEREIAHPHDVPTLISRGVDDRSIVVRRAALDGLIRNRRAGAFEASLLKRLAFDRSPSIRERVEYLRRTR